MGEPYGSGGLLWNPNSVIQIGHLPPMRWRERSLLIALVRRPRSRIDASSLFGVLTFGPPRQRVRVIRETRAGDRLEAEAAALASGLPAERPVVAVDARELAQERDRPDLL